MRYTLMHEDVPVLTAGYDPGNHVFTKIRRVLNPEHAPLGILDGRGQITNRGLMHWWRDRAIPASRDQMADMGRRLERLGVTDVRALLEKACGMSLSDRYWVSADPEGPGWDDLNFFDNAFSDDLGMLTLDGASPENPDLVSPNASSDGNLRKKWVIENGRRILIKEGSGAFLQEPYNELIATELYARVLEPGEYVPYELRGDKRRPLSACPNMLGDHEELVTAWDIVTSRKMDSHRNGMQNLVAAFSDLLGRDAERDITKMLALDVALANSDRHYRNFGLIRDARTLEFKHMAPIFDTGNSLWYDRRELEVPRDYSIKYKPFGADGYDMSRQLSFLTDFGWLDADALRTLPDTVRDVLSRARYLADERVELVVRACAENVDQVIMHAALVDHPRMRKHVEAPRKPAPATSEVTTETAEAAFRDAMPMERKTGDRQTEVD